jgi:hypothetical protein
MGEFFADRRPANSSGVTALGDRRRSPHPQKNVGQPHYIFENPAYNRVLVWGLSSVGRAPALQAGCRGFESRRLHQIANSQFNIGVSTSMFCFNHLSHSVGSHHNSAYSEGITHC